jgi:hypothetical protein
MAGQQFHEQGENEYLPTQPNELGESVFGAKRRQ